MKKGTLTKISRFVAETYNNGIQYAGHTAYILYAKERRAAKRYLKLYGPHLDDILYSDLAHIIELTVKY